MGNAVLRHRVRAASSKSGRIVIEWKPNPLQSGRMRFLRGLAAAIAIGVPLALCGIVFYFSQVILFPTGHVCKQEHYVYCSDPSAVNLVFENITLPTADGLRLSAWFIPGRAGAGGILLLHGHGATRREGLRYARVLHERGFHLLMPDLRGTGQSAPSPVTMGFRERRDVHASIDYLLTDRKLPAAAIMGFSMGAATSIMAMAEDRRIQAGVFEAGFSQLDRVLGDRAWHDYRIPRFPLVPAVRRLIELRANMSTIDPTPISAISRIAPRPIFILHGRKDFIVQHHEGEALFAAAGEPKRFRSHNGGHTRAWQSDTEYLKRELPQFFASVVPTGK